MSDQQLIDWISQQKGKYSDDKIVASLKKHGWSDTVINESMSHFKKKKSKLIITSIIILSVIGVGALVALGFFVYLLVIG